MAAGSITRVIRAPGRLVVGPTNLAAAYPYGGTEVGKTKFVSVQPIRGLFRVESEGLGDATDILESSLRYVFSCFVRGWDDDAVAQFFSGSYSAGSVSGHALFLEPGSMPGKSAYSRGLKLLYVPDDPIHVPAVLVYCAIIDWSDSAEIALQRGEEFGIPVAAECLRDANSRIIQIGMLSDLTLAPAP